MSHVISQKLPTTRDAEMRQVDLKSVRINTSQRFELLLELTDKLGVRILLHDGLILEIFFA